MDPKEKDNEEHVVSNTACILVQIPFGDGEWLKLMDCVLKCTLEKT